MANSWLAMDVLRELDEANARYFAVTLNSPSSMYYLVSFCCYMSFGPSLATGEVGGWKNELGDLARVICQRLSDLGRLVHIRAPGFVRCLIWVR